MPYILRCIICGRDINEIGQDNMSPSNDYALCEDCWNARAEHATQDDCCPEYPEE